MKKNICRPFFFLLAFVIAYPATSEEKYSNNQIDSLRKELTNEKGSDKFCYQLEHALRMMGNDHDKVLELAKSTLRAAQTANNKSLEMRAYFMLGKIYDVMDDRDLSEANYDTALTIAEASRDDWFKGEILLRKGEIMHYRNEDIHALEYFNASLQACRLSDNFKTMGSTYAMMGNIFRINGLYDRAIEYIVNSELNFEKAGFLEGYAWDSYLLGRIYSDLKLPQKAMEYFREALKIYSQMASVDGNQEGIAICNEQIGILNFDSGNFEEANKYFASTRIIYTANKSKFGLSNSKKNMGMIEYSRGNFHLAEKYLNESLKIKKEEGDVLNLPTVYEYLGLCLIGKGQKMAGFNTLNQGLTLAISNNQKKIQLNIYAKLTEVYLSINDLGNAISCQKKQIEIRDLILSGAANIKIEQVQAIYEIDKKNGQIAELEKQNEINSLLIKQHRISLLIMIMGIFAALLFSISVYWYNNKIRHKNLELKETNAAKDKFFAIIAHDLLGPTRNLASFLEHLNVTFNEHSPTELRKILLVLFKSAENVTLLLENLLIWAQSQLNKIEFNPEELKLTDVIHNSIKGLMQSAENKQIDIKLELNDQILVLADLNMVQTIVRNLFSNAIKFSHRGGSVVIKSDVRNMYLASIHIIDNGVGIEKSSLSKIFDISNTLHTKGTENEKSTGLGLMIVKGFIEKNKGTITIESEKGKGTIVSFTLPAKTSIIAKS